MRGLTEEERDIVVRETTPCVEHECVSTHPDTYLTWREYRVLSVLERRGITKSVRCVFVDDSHFALTPLGRTALLADAAVRGLVTT